MSNLTDIARRYGLTLLTIIALGAGALACLIFNMPTWLFVICLILLVFAVISLIGDLGLFGGGDHE